MSSRTKLAGRFAQAGEFITLSHEEDDSLASSSLGLNNERRGESRASVTRATESYFYLRLAGLLFPSRPPFAVTVAAVDRDLSGGKQIHPALRLRGALVPRGPGLRE